MAVNWDDVIVKSQEVVNIIAEPVCACVAIFTQDTWWNTVAAAAVVGAYNAIADCVLKFIRHKPAAE